MKYLIIVIFFVSVGQIFADGLQGRAVITADSDSFHDELIVFRSDMFSGYYHSRFKEDLQTTYGLTTPILSYGYLQPSGGLELLDCGKIPGNSHYLEKTHFCGLAPQRVRMHYQALSFHTPGRGLGIVLLNENEHWSLASWQNIVIDSWEAGFCQSVRPYGSVKDDDGWYRDRPYCPKGVRINFSPYIRYRSTFFQNQISGMFSVGENTAPGYQILEHLAITGQLLRIQCDYLFTSDEYWTFSAEKPLYRHQIRSQIWFNLAPYFFFKISDNLLADAIYRNDIYCSRRDDIRLSISGYIGSFDWSLETRYLSESYQIKDFAPQGQKYGSEIGYNFPDSRLSLKSVIYTEEDPKKIFILKGDANLPGRFLLAAQIQTQIREENWDLSFSSRLYWRHPSLTLMVWFDSAPIPLEEEIDWQDEWNQSVFGITLSLPFRIEFDKRNANF